MKRVWALVLVLAMVAVACGGGDEADETTATTEGTTETEATQGTDAAQGGEGDTLQAVRDRGSLRCGVSTVAVGFAEPQDDGSFNGFDADYCRALAAAIFGDASAVEFVGTTAAERFTVLANGGVDVLFRTTTWTQSRDTEIGGDFGPTTFFDGQQVMGTAAFGFTADSTLADIGGARLCTNAGTTTEKNITEGARVLGVEIELVTVETVSDAIDLLIDKVQAEIPVIEQIRYITIDAIERFLFMQIGIAGTFDRQATHQPDHYVGKQFVSQYQPIETIEDAAGFQPLSAQDHGGTGWFVFDIEIGFAQL